ncbi:class I SAM-dependent methyltransferase [Scytonema hofmannii FACHB-248]|uniref:Class I SAM-dependent methyltransferase n=1 Tax=Scytonema hofmannii FACHB-248 TaxID=1842502 RepID=A0ABR8GWL0_9CYAN|nr:MULTISPECIES: class I SAM-dependent methyltransferase [Nostocales]MBD2607445.1 class I SAM-dependent methyltransferase [Scytonema hofmannii FACHB-248]
MTTKIHNNFLPPGSYQYSQYEELGNVRDRIAQDLKYKAGSQVLDVGTGNGLFTFALARAVPNVQILGLDIVKGTVRDAVRRSIANNLADTCKFACNNFLRVRLPENYFDTITFFLSLSDLLRWTTLEEILQRVSVLLNDSGKLVICEGFPEDAENDQQLLGFALNDALGYRNCSKHKIITALEDMGMAVDSISTYHTGRPSLNSFGVQDFIKDECFFCTLDGSFVPPWEEIWQEFEPFVNSLGSIEIDAQISVIVASNSRFAHLKSN